MSRLDSNIHCLTLRPPWGGLVMWAGKDVENRQWPMSFRGRIAIHQGISSDFTERETALALWEKIRGSKLQTIDDYRLWEKICHCGAILGTVEITDCVTSSVSPWFFGPFGFVLRDPRPLTVPIPALGKLGLWTLDPETERKVLEAGG